MGKFFKYIAIFLLLFAFEAKAELPARDPALVKALVKGDMNQFYSMIEGGFPVNAVDENGNSALHVAAFNGNRRIVDYLILAGANPNQQNYASETPSVVARRGGFEQLSDYLKYSGYNNNRESREYANQNVARNSDFIPPAPTSSSTVLGVSTSVVTSTLFGVGVIGGAVAIAAGSSGSSQTNNPTTPTIPDLNFNIKHPQNLNPSSFTDGEYNANYGLVTINSANALARGYDGSIYNRNADGTLVSTTPTGGKIKVAVIDSGINSAHTDLIANVNTTLSRDCSSGTCLAGGTTDAVGHGTFVAGIIGALDNGVGVQGVAPKVDMISVKLPDSFTTANVGENLRYVNTVADVKAINLSLGNVASFVKSEVPNLTVEGSATPNIPYDGAVSTSVFDTSFPIVDGQVYYDDAGVRKRVLNGPAATNFSSLYNLPGSHRITGINSYNSATIAQGFYNAYNVSNGVSDNITNKRIFVLATGNESHDNPSVEAGLPYYFSNLTPYWIAVTSTDATNTISDFANRCGVAKDWCIAAPGEAVTSTSNSGGYVSGSGTSFSTPAVTGAVAVLSGAFPHLDATIIRRIILETATDLGVAGVDDIYGHGLLDLNKATDPTTGGWGVTLSGSFASSGYSFADSNLKLNSSFGDALSNSNLNVMFLDEYKKNYYVPLNYFASNTQSQLSSNPSILLENFAEKPFDNSFNLNDNLTLNYSLENKSLGDELFTRHTETKLDKFMASYSFNGSNSMSVFSGLEANQFANFSAVDGVVDDNILISKSLSNPYLALSDSSSGLSMQNGNGTISQKLLVAEGSEKDAPDSSKTKAISYSVSYKPSKINGVVSLESGMLDEPNSFLGSTADGAFNLKDNNKTYFQNISSKYNVSDNLSLYSSYTLGLSQVNTSDNSIFKSFSDVISNSYSLGFAYSNALKGNDKLGFNYSTPLRVIKGSSNVSLPTSINASTGDIISTDAKISLVPQGREQDFELFYSSNLNEKTKLGLSSLLRLEPDNIQIAKPEAIFMLKLFYEF